MNICIKKRGRISNIYIKTKMGGEYRIHFSADKLSFVLLSCWTNQSTTRCHSKKYPRSSLFNICPVEHSQTQTPHLTSKKQTTHCNNYSINKHPTHTKAINVYSKQFEQNRKKKKVASMFYSFIPQADSHLQIFSLLFDSSPSIFSA